MLRVVVVDLRLCAWQEMLERFTLEQSHLEIALEKEKHHVVEEREHGRYLRGEVRGPFICMPDHSGLRMTCESFETSASVFVLAL